MNEEKTVIMTVAFYSPEQILLAKEVIFSKCSEDYIKRRQSKQYPNPSMHDVVDILELFERKSDILPQFVANGYGAMPSNEFEKMAAIMCSMRDELCSLRVELCETRKDREKDIKIMEDNTIIKQELTDLKMMMREITQKRENNVSAPEFKVKNIKKNTGRITEARPMEVLPPTSEAIDTGRITEARPMEVLPATSKTMSFSEALLSRPGPFNGTMDKRRTREETPFVRKRSKDVRGISEHSVVGFGAAQRIVNLYIGRCTVKSTVEGIKKFCSDNKVELIEATELNARGDWYKSFKISLDAKHEEEIMRPEFWSKGIIVRKFFFKRRITLTETSI